jgi:hypothetical protein
MKFTKHNAAAMGAKGGRRTAERHGQEHMRAIGVRGFWTTVLRHWGGDARAYVNYLIMLGLAATDAVPQNGAFEHDRRRIYWQARYGHKNYLPTDWRPPAFPDDLEPPY